MRAKMFQKRKENPNLDHLLSLFNNETLSAFIKGHLIIEALLIQFIELKSEVRKNSNFPDKVERCVELNFFNNNISVFLLYINDIRNNYAHNLGYDLTSDELFLLVRNAGEAGIDFSDETIYTDKNHCTKYYSKTDIVQEIFQNTVMELSYIIESKGGEFKFY